VKENNLIKIKEGAMKNPILVISLVILLFLTFGCQNKAEKAELEKFRAQAKLEEQNKELFRKTCEMVSTWNLEYVNVLVAPDYAYFYPSENPKSMSKEETIASVKMFKDAFPDLSFNIVESVAGGDLVVSRYIIRGTHKGTFQGIPATGNKIEIDVMNWCYFRDGKVVMEREDYDMLGLMQQLGMELKPIAAKKK
jgi:steroid delta-isomerase-like uncharacterized protein